MAIDEYLPPACAFAVSVLLERDQDPDAVPEEAVEAAQLHMQTCSRCLSSPPAIAPPRKKKRTRRSTQTATSPKGSTTATTSELSALPDWSTPQTKVPGAQELKSAAQAHQISPSVQTTPVETPALSATGAPASSMLPAVTNGPIDCLQCRQLLPEYAEAVDSGQNVALLYPEVHEHLLTCETGCLVLLDLFQQEAKANRKFRRRPVRDPFSAIGWELSGFFRGGQVPMSPMALSYGTLILLLLIASLSVFLAVRWDDARYYHPPVYQVPTPDGIGLSDGLHIYDACNAGSYQNKRAAAQAMAQQNNTKADRLLTSAITAASTDSTGCNGAEAAIYHEDLKVRQSGRPYGVIAVSFDSGPGDADPTGGTDRHILYAAYTQELVGAFIAQQQYNDAQMQTAGAPLLYLVLANTTGVEQGALQVASAIASMARATNLHTLGLLAQGQAPLLGVLGLAPSNLLQVVLPVLCQAGVPVIAPTATGLFIVNLLLNTSLYRHCAPGFAFVRFSPDDAAQSLLAASYAYSQLHAHNVAVFYDPSNPSSQGSADAFVSSFTHYRRTRVVAQETAVASGLLAANGRPQASADILQAGLNDALSAQPRPDLIYAPLLTNDVITLAQDIAKLPANQQPVLMIGGEFVHPSALQGLAQWARQQQLSLPRIFVSLTSAARSPDNGAHGDWQRQFYASFCTSFATPGSFCSGAAALDQGALLFADGIELFARAVGPLSSTAQFPTAANLVKLLSQQSFEGVSCPIVLHSWGNVLITSTHVSPVILGVQTDGSVQIVG